MELKGGRWMDTGGVRALCEESRASESWAPESRAAWRALPAAQQPEWPDRASLHDVLAELECYPPLVSLDECARLRGQLAEAARGRAFVLQGGDCAETFDGVSPGAVRRKLRTLRRMAATLTHAVPAPVIEIGRLAGQYAKPRSMPVEVRDGTALPAYRGDAVNGLEFSARARTPDPTRLRRTYQASAATLALVRRLGGVYTSHEALILDYESALTRSDPRTRQWYGSSGHLLWIGDRTRQLDGAHVAFASRIANPVGVKLGPTTEPAEALALIDRLDPHRTAGRLTFIVRMGARRIRDLLPGLVEKVTAEGAQVLWVCDPMHGNTITAPSGHKTRRFDDVCDEVRGFFEVHHALGTHPGGIHLELTGDDVTECLGGSSPLVDDLHRRYETVCDPRLNRTQAVELACIIAELRRGRVSTHAVVPTTARHRTSVAACP